VPQRPEWMYVGRKLMSLFLLFLGIECDKLMTKRLQHAVALCV
jgi:hypothetical protein